MLLRFFTISFVFFGTYLYGMESADNDMESCNKIPSLQVLAWRVVEQKNYITSFFKDDNKKELKRYAIITASYIEHEKNQLLPLLRGCYIGYFQQNKIPHSPCIYRLQWDNQNRLLYYDKNYKKFLINADTKKCISEQLPYNQILEPLKKRSFFLYSRYISAIDYNANNDCAVSICKNEFSSEPIEKLRKSKLYLIRNGHLLPTVMHEYEKIHSVLWHATNSNLFACAAFKNAYVYDVAVANLVPISLPVRIRSLAWAPSRDELLLGMQDKSIVAWDATDTITKILETTASVRLLQAFASDTNDHYFIAYATKRDQMIHISSSRGEKYLEIPLQDSLLTFSFNNHTKQLAVADKHSITLYNLNELAKFDTAYTTLPATQQIALHVLENRDDLLSQSTHFQKIVKKIPHDIQVERALKLRKNKNKGCCPLF